ncbi:MAG: hypothetical protein ACREHD_26815 [Pirellulales bacterium]
MEQPELVRKVIATLESQRLPYMVVGSLASAVYGQPRLTQDIDVVVALPVSEVDRLCTAFPSPEFYVSVPAARQAAAQGGQFNIIHPASGNKIDVMVARQDAWGRSQLARRRRELIFPQLPGFVAAPEDVIIGKLWYYDEGGSEKHLRDIVAIFQVSGAALDRAYLEHWSRSLGLTAAWQAVLARCDENAAE